MATTHAGVISYTASAEILQKEGLELDKKKFYRLQDKEAVGELTRQEELQVLLTHLQDEGFHPRVRAEYVETAGGNRSRRREVRDLFWMSPEQIKLARRFVSGFMYETDATFNTNSLKLPLSVMVGIDNTGATFPMAYCYITSESAASFKWIAEQLTELAFYNCPKPALIIGDFSKGLGAAVAAKAAADLASLEPTDEIIIEQDDPDFPDVTEVVVDKGQKIYLQLCEWHAIQAIKRRLVAAGRYSKERREEIINKINQWVKADIDSLNEKRDELLKELHDEEKEYIRKNYQPKEPQFCRAYTRTYLNLGVHSTQRNESYHVVVKQKLHKHLPISKAVRDGSHVFFTFTFVQGIYNHNVRWMCITTV